MIDPATEDPDEIVQLFDEWRKHLAAGDGSRGVHGGRIAKITRKRVYEFQAKVAI